MKHEFVFQTAGTVRTPRSRNEQPAARFLRGHNRRLFANLPGAAGGEEEPIHQVRVASRRLRVALPVAARKPGGRRVRRAVKRLRALTRLAGEGRDLDVCAGIFAEELPRAGLPEAVEAMLHSRLQAARSRAHLRLAKGLADFDAAKLRATLGRILGRGGAEADDARMILATASRRQARTALAELRALGGRFDALALHTVRRQVRWLRYYAELDQVLFKGSRANVRSLKDLQEVLGQLHDALVLADWIARVAASWETRGNRQQAAAARAFTARLQDRAQILHRSFLAKQPAVRLRAVLKRGAILLTSAAR